MRDTVLCKFFGGHLLRGCQDFYCSTSVIGALAADQVSNYHVFWANLCFKLSLFARIGVTISSLQNMWGK